LPSTTTDLVTSQTSFADPKHFGLCRGQSQHATLTWENQPKADVSWHSTSLHIRCTCQKPGSCTWLYYVELIALLPAWHLHTHRNTADHAHRAHLAKPCKACHILQYCVFIAQSVPKYPKAIQFSIRWSGLVFAPCCQPVERETF
jgi:hypothetical protein